MEHAPKHRIAVEYLPIERLEPNPQNARTHPSRQLKQLARGLREFGFNVPILATRKGKVIAGHGRLDAAKLDGMTEVPVIFVEHLNDDQIRAFALFDNRIAEDAGWDRSILAIELQHLQTVCDFDVTLTGFEIPEIDLIIEEADGKQDPDDRIEAGENLPAVTKPGDVWKLGRHAVACADARDPAAYAALLGDRRADMVFTDPPYNVRVDGHATGKGRIRHREFAMACGEMAPQDFAEFLRQSVVQLAAHSRDGSVHYICMDWAHAGILHDVGESTYSKLLNICVWAKNNGGMGSFYRSQHEFVFVFKTGKAGFRNNIQLGRFGRNRSNVWNYSSPSAFGRAGEEGNLAALHPTVKPVAMIADAILDCTARGESVLDSFLGSGSTLLAAERVGRVCAGIELDPLYVDVAVRRWQRHTGESAIHAESGKRFDDFAGETAHV